MKLLHHVKKHGKTITLHLKKHHKKYIFGILSATLLRKGVSLIAAYALVHNLSFSFADIIHHEGENEQIVETEITEEIITEETGNDNEEFTEEIELNEEENNEEEPLVTQEGEDEEENGNNEELNEETNDGGVTNDDDGNTNEEDDTEEEEDTNEELTNTGEGDNEENINYEGNLDNGNGICDRGDIVITSPIKGDIVGGIFGIEREFTNNDCQDNTYAIKLRDQNDQYLAIYSGDTQKTGFTFDSTQLITEFYTITGTNESGDTIILHEGMYEGNATDYFSGHKLSIVSDEGETIYRIEEGGEFTIDNKKPEISNINIEYSTKNEKLSIGDTVTIIFESDEELKDTTVNILGQYANLEEKVGNKYKYSMDFSEENTIGKIVYGITFKDKIGNEGYIEGYDNRELDYTKPTISNLSFTSIGDGKIRITFNTNKKTDTNFIYQLSGINSTKDFNSTGKDQHRITIEDIRRLYTYNYSIAVQDEANNAIYVGGTFNISGNDVIFTSKEIQKSEILTNIGFKNNESNPQIFTNTFYACSEDIKTKTLKITINKQKNINVKVPEYKDATTKKTANAFIAVLSEKIESKNLSQNALDEIAEDLNNFLIVVKLVKDDNNQCKQNMTQYYINRFKNTLEKHGIIK